MAITAITIISSSREKPAAPARPGHRRYGAQQKGDRESRMQEQLETLNELGISLPSAAYIVGVILFGIVGLLAYYRGKRAGRPRTRWLGLALMLYPYIVWQTWLMYLVGIGLCIAIWIDLG
jgi:hypothetical protein